MKPSGPVEEDGFGAALGCAGSSDGISGIGSAETDGDALGTAERDGRGESLGAGMKVGDGLGRALRLDGLGDGEALDGEGDGERVGVTEGSGMIGEGAALADDEGEGDGEGDSAAATVVASSGSRTDAAAASSAPLRRPGMAASVRRGARAVMTTDRSGR